MASLFLRNARPTLPALRISVQNITAQVPMPVRPPATPTTITQNPFCRDVRPPLGLPSRLSSASFNAGQSSGLIANAVRSLVVDNELRAAPVGFPACVGDQSHQVEGLAVMSPNKEVSLTPWVNFCGLQSLRKHNQVVCFIARAWKIAGFRLHRNRFRRRKNQTIGGMTLRDFKEDEIRLWHLKFLTSSAPFVQPRWLPGFSLLKNTKNNVLPLGYHFMNTVMSFHAENEPKTAFHNVKQVLDHLVLAPLCMSFCALNTRARVRLYARHGACVHALL